MKKLLRSYGLLILCLTVIVSYINSPNLCKAYADYTPTCPTVDVTNSTSPNISTVFGDYQKQVDENIFNSLTSVGSSTLVRIYGDVDTPIFKMAKETINPCMALATTWGEAGASYKGVSLTTVMDFNPTTYVNPIDWINVTKNLQQVGADWYYTNTNASYNTNEEGKAYLMPNSLLQFPSNGSRQTSAMVGLGVGPFQVTSSDWEKYDLECRVNPVYGYEVSLSKVGTAWVNCGIVPTSDLTIYALLSLGHQGGALITYDFGKKLINTINDENIQRAFYEVGYKIYTDLIEKQSYKQCSLADINLNIYYNMLVEKTGIDFSTMTGGPGPTNKGTYVTLHCLRYCFYKYYFTGGYL